MLTGYNTYKDQISSPRAAIAVVDNNMNYLVVSEEWISLYQLKGQALTGKSHYEILPQVSNQFKNLFDLCLAGIPQSDITFSLSSSAYTAGKTIIMKLSHFKNESGSVAGLIMSCEEMPIKLTASLASKTAKKADRSELQVRWAFSNSLIPVAVMNPDATLRMANNSLCKMLGYTEKELKATALLDTTQIDDTQKSLEMVQFLTGKHLEGVKFETQYHHKNGNIILAECNATMVFDNLKRPLYYICQIDDITERKNIKDTLIRNERKYRTIFENVQDVFYQIDKEGFINEISPSIRAHGGFVREKIIGTVAKDTFFHPQDYLKFLLLLRKNKTLNDYEVKFKSSTNELKYASVNAKEIVIGGQVIGVEGSVRDITTRKLAENNLTLLNSELKQSNEVKSKLLSIIVHDLRNPIGGSLQLLDMTIDDFDSVDSSEIKTSLVAVKKEIASANNLLEDLLEWAKIQFNSLESNKLQIENLSGLIDKSVETILPMSTKKQIEIKVEISDLHPIVADKRMLETILRNLMSNAVKFTPVNGKIILSVTSTPHATTFAINDSGAGIPKDKIALLFSPKYYATRGTVGEKGNGIGLGICSDLVNIHKGKIWVTSEEGTGSTFYFSIPTIIGN